jgi:hypothetical protein
MHINRAFCFSLLFLAACGAEEQQPATSEVETQQQELSFQDKLVVPNSNLGKAIYKAEMRQWVRWALKLPWSTGPVMDTTGVACGQGQSGPVWFLAGTTGGPVTRDCTVPKNKLLFFPLVNDWVTPPPDYEDLAGAQEFVNEYFPELRAATCQLELKLDGQPILANHNQRAAKLDVNDQSPFSIEMNADNFSEGGLPAGHYPSVWARGHYALLLPLSPGDHTLEFGGQHCDDIDGVWFETHATYRLHVGN